MLSEPATLPRLRCEVCGTLYPLDHPRAMCLRSVDGRPCGGLLVVDDDQRAKST